MTAKSVTTLLFCFAVATTGCLAQAESPSVTPLRDNWRLQSGCKLQIDGAIISSADYRPKSWYDVKVPSTVLAAQVAAGVVKNPFIGTNLRDIAGTTYPIGENFSNLPMPEDSPYHCAWWYRTNFSLPTAERGHQVWLRFGGINYRANIWLNGKLIADSQHVAGAYRTYEFNVTSSLKYGRENVLAVETLAPTEKDLGINWVDWNPCPPDKDMGLTGPVDLVTSGSVTIRSPLVTSHFPDKSLSTAQLTVYAELHNASDHPIKGILNATVAGIHLTQSVSLEVAEDKTVVFDPQQYALLNVRNPRVWWPYVMGEPHLETASLQFDEAGKISDTQSVRFGIREVTSEFTEKGARLFRVNGKPILIRGAGWSQDMLLREEPGRLADQFRLVRDMHLNTIRLEGKLETDHFLQLADEQGILIMLGWCCCDQWEHWDKWTPETLEIATASLRSQMLRIRNHPSLLVWLNGSDNPPPANVEHAYLDVEAQTHWPNPILSSASQTPTSVTGKSGVKMSGPYDFVAPSYWLTDTHQFGGAYGFNTETSPGPAIPVASSLRRFLSPDKRWPPNDQWAFHNGGGGFKTLTVYNDSLAATYGPAEDLTDYLKISQTLSYDGERAMFEAYSRNKYTSTGVIQWMLNNAWPSMIWHLYDYYLDAGGGYFGTKKACEPLHVQYSYDDHSIYVVNSTYTPAARLTVSAKVYDLNLKVLFSKSTTLDVDADASVQALAIPDSIFSGASQVYLIRLSLNKQSGEQVSNNFYWIPSKLTTFDWPKTDYTHTPSIEVEKMTELRKLPKARLDAEVSILSDGDKAEVRVHNVSAALAFQVATAAFGKDKEAITPVLWSDNYIELMPGETRVLIATLPGKITSPTIEISGWNVVTQDVQPGPVKVVTRK